MSKEEEALDGGDDVIEMNGGAADIEQIDYEYEQPIVKKQEDVPTYWAFACVAIIINPPLGLLALFFSCKARSHG